jgi:hypothetical protein
MPPTLAAVTPVGAFGAVAGVTAEVAAEGPLVPAELTAVTVKVYDVPAASPLVIVQVVAVAPAAVHVPPAGLDVTE